MIRPRGGDFIYSGDELEIMKHDIRTCRDLGCDGVVFGMLNPDGSINKDQCSRLVECAYPMGVTFHRAFDHAANPFEALEEIIKAGFERVLTSGQMSTAAEGSEFIGQLVRHAEHRIIIMPGSGIRAGTIQKIAEKTGAHEFHSSAGRTKPPAMEYFNPAMKEELTHIIADEKEISSMVGSLDHFFRKT
jgi:copper homeostasis protein